MKQKEGLIAMVFYCAISFIIITMLMSFLNTMISFIIMVIVDIVLVVVGVYSATAYIEEVLSK